MASNLDDEFGGFEVKFIFILKGIVVTLEFIH